jgi:hypothetical protein
MIRILYPDDAGVIQTIALLDLETTHDMTTTPTDHAVEDGADVTDHVKVELDSFESRVFITNAMIEPAESQMNGVVSEPFSVDVPDGGGSFTVLGLSEAVDRVQLVYQELQTLRRLRRPVTILTGLRRYESMIVTRMAWPETNKDGMEVTLAAREIRVVSTTTAAAPRPLQVRGHRRANAGTVATQETSPEGPQPPPVDNRSTAAQLLDGLGSLFGG